MPTVLGFGSLTTLVSRRQSTDVSKPLSTSMLTANVSWQGVLTLGTTSKVRDESSIRSQAALVCSFEHLRLRRSLTSARTRGLKGLFSRRRHALTVTVCVSKAPLLFFRVGLEGEFNSDSKVRNPKNLGPSMAPAPILPNLILVFRRRFLAEVSPCLMLLARTRLACVFGV